MTDVYCETGDVAQLNSHPRRHFYTGGDPRRALAIADMRARTHRLMPRFVLEYLEGGSGQELTLEREREAYSDWLFTPHTLVDESRRSLGRDILGRPARMPMIVGPTGLNGLFGHSADGDLAKGAARFGVPFVQSTMSNERLEKVAAIDGLRHWWQLYVFGGDEIWQDLIDRAQKAGCEALVLTTNSQIFGQREWSSRTRINGSRPSFETVVDSAFHPAWLARALSHGMPVFENVVDYVPKDKRGFFESAGWIREQMPRSLSWSHVARIRARWRGPFFVKGILNLDDVRRAQDSGVDGIILGSHGGRQADSAISALDILPQARAIVGDRMALYMSGGVRRGSDLLKALALGADAVISGRAILYGLCAYGEAGVERALQILHDEAMNELGQIGIPGISALTPDILVARRAIQSAAE